MRVTQILAKDPGGNSVLDYSYTYDKVGNILSKTDCTDARPCVSTSYIYDALSRLTDVQVDIPGEENEGFSYDAVGNRTAASNADGDIMHNANNELTVYGELAYDYDQNGNMTTVMLNGQVIFRYNYNAQYRLVTVEGGNNTTIAEYYYDPFGRRLWKEVASTRSYFFYANKGLIAEYDVSGTELKGYGYRPDSTWTTNPLFMRSGGEYHFYQNDHLGTPQKLIKQNGAITWSSSYNAFGLARMETEVMVNNLRFPGQYFDTETGLHYNFHRYYASGLGRYLQNDPLGLKAGVNLFVYAQNNPVTNSDSLGLYVDCDGVGGSVAAGTPIPKLSGAGSAALLKCRDDSGSYGVFLCFGGGFGIGTGFVAGAQWTRFYVHTICELASCGITPSASFGAAIGIGMVLEITPGETDTIIMGGGIGEFGGGASLFSCCHPIFARNKCGFPICGPKNPVPDYFSPADGFWYNYYTNQPR